jgi:aminoglycoside/choline kinase family phosphotransferase
MTSTSSSDLLLHQTRIRFPAFSDAKVKISPIEKGGSDRRFYRIHFSPDQTIILVKYSLEREENRLYAQIAEFLAENEIRAPKVYFHDPTEGLIWIEDLGEIDLWNHRDETWLVRRALYESALDEVAKLHRLPPESAQIFQPHLAPEFNAALYQWEQGYFFENCLGRYFGLSGQQISHLAALPRLQQIAQKLGDMPRVLVHRDFQSQNIIVRNSQAYLIDFQGMRPGLAEYDLASLFYDPYVTLSEAERSELLEYYGSLRGKKLPDISETFDFCAMQRLMQALGAYGFLGLVKGSKSFLNYIEPAIGSLRLLIEDKPGLEQLEQTLTALPVNAKTR